MELSTHKRIAADTTYFYKPTIKLKNFDSGTPPYQE
jgi:hypothetical protein